MCLKKLLIHTITFLCVAETQQHTCQILESDHLWNRNIYIIMTDDVFPLLFKLCSVQPRSAFSQKHNANVLWLMHAGRPEAPASMHTMMRAIFAMLTAAFVFGGNYATRAALSLTHKIQE